MEIIGKLNKNKIIESKRKILTFLKYFFIKKNLNR